MKTSSATLLAMPLAASLLLAGCGGDKPRPDSRAGSTATTSPTTSPTPSGASPTTTPTTSAPAVDPNMPAAARARTPAGAEAFVRYFYARVNMAWTKPVSGLVGQLGLGTCKSCASLEGTAAELVARSRRYDGDPLTIGSVSALGATSGGTQVVLLRATQEMRNVLDAGGRVVLTDQRKQGDFELALNWTDSGWKIATIKSVS